MARVKYGAIITEIKGKVGGTIFQGGRSGGIMKNMRRKPGDPIPDIGEETFPQRARFATATKNWSALTATQRTGWAALLGTWQFVDKFGDTYNGTAYQIQTAANINRQLLGLSLLSDAPTFEAAVNPNITLSDYSISGGWNKAITNAASIGQYLFTQFGPAVHPTKAAGHVAYPESVATLIASTSPADLRPAYLAIFGVDPPIGSVIYLKIWTCLPNYPKAQFATTLVSQVTA